MLPSCCLLCAACLTSAALPTVLAPTAGPTAVVPQTLGRQSCGETATLTLEAVAGWRLCCGLKQQQQVRGLRWHDRAGLNTLSLSMQLQHTYIAHASL